MQFMATNRGNMQHQKIGFPSNTPNSKAVGYFTEETFEFTNSKGEKVERTYVMLKHWVPGSVDYSSTPCKDNSEGAKLRKEWSQAWEHYEKEKAKGAVAAPEVPTAVEYGIKGTPIESLTFLGHDHLARLKAMGFLTAEQLRDMTDTICDRVGFGARNWRKKANEHLIVAEDQARAAFMEQPRVPTADVMAAMAKMQEQMAGLMEQLTAANAKIADMEAKAAAPVPRAARQRKAATEARAEA